MTDIAVIALSLGLEKNHMMQDYQSNRPVRQQPPGRFPNESERTVERIRKIKKKQTQRRMVLYGVIAALAVIVVGIILLAKRLLRRHGRTCRHMGVRRNDHLFL